MEPSNDPIVIVGAGLAGLCCALRLSELKLPCLILEASDRVGGRVATDAVDGFLLDRGFQVLLTAYPEANKVLDMPALDLKPFSAGALVFRNGRLRRFFDLRRHPGEAIGTFFSGLATVGDQWRATSLWSEMRSVDPEELLKSGPERTTEEELAARGFSKSSIDHFFRPFFGGVFLQSRLTTSSRFFRYTFRMFADGRAAVPAGGMGQIAKQLQSKLQAANVPIQFGANVAKIGSDVAETSDGRRIAASAVIVATEMPVAEKLLMQENAIFSPPAANSPAAPRWPTYLGSGQGVSRSACTLYFAAPKPPVGEATLVLNGDGPAAGPINHLAEMTAAAPTYAPAGTSLIAASVLDTAGMNDGALESAVRKQLSTWFGDDAGQWTHLRTYHIPHALPPLEAPTMDNFQRPVHWAPGVYVCGDHRDQSSIQGAMKSGRRAADRVAADWKDLPVNH
jgi:phytoene dehydrogenase-like protein